MDYDDPRRKDVQKKINDIEKWMIENKIGSIKEVTKWNDNKYMGMSESYPHNTGYIFFNDLYKLKEKE